MVVDNISEFLINNKYRSKFLSIDFGLKNLGIAISDDTNLIAIPFKTLNELELLNQFPEIMREYNISGIPVTDPKTKKLEGIITNRDVRFASNQDQKVHELMTKDNLITVNEGVTQAKAKAELHKYRIEKLIIVDNKYRCIVLITVKDMEKSTLNQTE